MAPPPPLPPRPQQPPRPPPPPRPPGLLKKGISMDRSQVPMSSQQAMQPAGHQPPPAPSLPTALGQPGAGAPHKWAPVQTDQPGKKQQEHPHMGMTFPESVFPDSEDRSTKKVFRFPLHQTPSPDEAPSSTCASDQPHPPPVYTQTPSFAAARSPVRQPKKLPNVAGSAGLTFAEELQLRSNMHQQQAIESQGHQSQQTHENRPIPAPRKRSRYEQMPASRGPPQDPGFVTPPQYLPELEVASEPLLVVPKRPRAPRHQKSRVGPHKYATPDSQQPAAPGEGEYVNFPEKTAPQVSGRSQAYTSTDTSIYSNLPSIPQPQQHPTDEQQPMPQDHYALQPGWPLRNVKPNSQGLIPPAPPLRDRTHDTEQKLSDSPQVQSPAVPGSLPRHPASRMDSVEYGSPASTPRKPPHDPEGRGSAGVLKGYDQFVGSQNVVTINEDNFDNVIALKELAMVMFYDPSNPISLQPKEYFKKAADTMSTVKRQFAAVDCNVQTTFCASQGVSLLPTFKIYSSGQALSTILDMSRFDDNQMRKYMDIVLNMHPAQKKTFPKMSHISKCSIAQKLGFKK